MKSKLFISLSTIALVGISLATYAVATKYTAGGTEIPKGDCLEMLCSNGCVEEEGTFNGHCCPSAGSVNEACKPDGVSLDACCQGDKGLLCSTEGTCVCQTGMEWDGSRCVKCSFGGREYVKNENVVECGYCESPASNSILTRNPDPCAGRSDGKTVCDTATWTCVCPSGQVLGCDGVCGSGKVVGCDNVCGSGKVDIGCGCGIGLTAEGCCQGQVKGCDGVCGSGKTDSGCGCGITDRTAEGCCPGVVKGCDGVCGSGKTDAGCGCGIECPTCSGTQCGTNCCNSNQDCVNGECLTKLYCSHFSGNPCRTNVMDSEIIYQASKRGYSSVGAFVEALCPSSYTGAWVRLEDKTCSEGGKKYYGTGKSEHWKYSSVVGSSSHDGICKDKSKSIGYIYSKPYTCHCSHSGDCP